MHNKKIKMMKYIFLLLITLSVTLGGCSDEWLNDIEPQGKLLESNYYTTTNEIENGLISVYNMFKNQYWQGSWSSWYMYSSVASDDAVANYGDHTDMAHMWNVTEYNVTPINDGLWQIWDRIYYGAYRANVVISRVDPAGGGNNLAMIAEAKMLRAYFYFDLIKFFGEGPLIDHVLTPEEYLQPKATKAEIFAFIVKDLLEAAPDLPARWTGKDAYRMTKYGAHGLLGKVYMYMASPYYNIQDGNDYIALAKEQLKKVIDEGGYELLADYDQIWWYANEFNNETLIEISYSFDPNDGFGANGGGMQTSNVWGKAMGPRGIGSNDTLNDGWGFDMVTQDLVDEYRAQGDSIRLHGTVLADWQMVEWGISGFDNSRAGYTSYYSKKRTSWKASNPTGANWGYGTNERMLRLGDIYLLYAEACAISGDNATAITYANMTRTRAGLGSVELIPGATLLDKIKLERRLELGQEGNRFFDLVRWGDAIEVLNAQPVVEGINRSVFEERHFHYPIPQREIDAAQGLLIQREGY